MASKRVLIIGDGGSGKSTFALKLGTALNIPVTHLDLLRCSDTFQRVEAEVYRRRHDAVLAQGEWIIEGIPRGYPWVPDDSDPLGSPTSRQRLKDCEAVVFLDYPPLRALWRSLRRSRAHPEGDSTIPKQARFEFNRSHIRCTLDFYFRLRPRILIELKSLQGQGKIVIIAGDDEQAAGALASLTGPAA